MVLPTIDTSFLNSFDHISTKPIHRNKLEVFMIKVNANEFDYTKLVENLLEPMIDFSLSRKIKRELESTPHHMVRTAKERFVDYFNNKGELGELLLYCFLETHLKAPKILSKLELKTSTKMYVHGADGVHLLRLDNGDYQLLFGESKTYADLPDAIYDSLGSIYEYKNEINKKGEEKSGISHEKGLISVNLEKETFSVEEKEYIKSIIYPNADSEINIDDAFGIFLGYEIEITSVERKLSNSEFRNLIRQKIDGVIENQRKNIEAKIEEKNLIGHDFYIYTLPFTNLDESRRKIMEELLK